MPNLKQFHVDSPERPGIDLPHAVDEQEDH